MFGNENNYKRNKIIGKIGSKYFLIPAEDIVLIYTSNKITTVLDKEGGQYLLDQTLSRLEHELDNKNFFRANRQFIINIDYIKSFRTYEKSKLIVDLSITFPNKEFCIIISQENISAFKQWLSAQ